MGYVNNNNNNKQHKNTTNDYYMQDEKSVLKIALTDGYEFTLVESPVRVKVRLPTETTHTVSDGIFMSMTVREAKCYLEEVYGIPIEFMRLGFLEDSDMVDTKRLFDYVIVPGSTLVIQVWDDWHAAYCLVMEGKLFDVLSELKYDASGANGWAALYLAAARGSLDLCQSLMQIGAHPDLATTRLVYEQGPVPFNMSVVGFKPRGRGTGRTPLHAGMDGILVK